MTRRPAGMEPTTIASYDDVSWYRKQWFVWLLVLFFIPPLFFLAATGNLYAKANRKMREHSDAAVWKYTAGGKGMIFAAGLIFAVLGAIQIASFIAAREDAPRRSTAAATERAEVDDSGSETSDRADEETNDQSTPSTAIPATTTPPTTAVTATTTTTIVDGPTAEIHEAILELAEDETLDQDILGRIATIADEFPPIPIPDDAALQTTLVKANIGRGRRLGEVDFTAFSIFRTSMSLDEAVELYREDEMLLADLPEREFQTGSDDDGPFVQVDFGDFGSHPDPSIDWSVLNLLVQATDEGTQVRTSHSVNRLLDELPDGSILDRLGDATPLLADHQLAAAEVTLFYGDFLSVMTLVDVVAPRVVSEPSSEIEQIAESYRDTGEWVVTETDDKRVRYERPEPSEVRGSTVIGFISSDETIISHRSTLR